MSYFFGANEINGSTLAGKKKHCKHKRTSNDSEIEQIHGLRHRRKHSSRKKCIFKPKAALKESLRGNYKEDVLSSKRQSASTVIKEKDELITILRKKYQKLEQNYYQIQADNNKINVLLSQRENEYKQLHGHHEESLLVIENFEVERNDFISSIKKLKYENLQLNGDINLLKNLVFRLNIEIEKYQDKLRISGQSIENHTTINIEDGTEVDCKNKNIWQLWEKVNFHALGPLLDAYQENMIEKDELLNKYKREIDTITGKIKDVLLENESLHTEMKSLQVKCDKFVDEMKSLEKNTIIIKEKNKFLTRQTFLQKQKMKEIYAEYRQKVESMSQDNNKLHNDNMIYKTQMRNLEGKYEILNEGYGKLDSNSEKTMPVFVHNAANEKCERLFEDLKQQFESEKKNFNFQLKKLEEIQLENKNASIAVIIERDELKLHVRNLEKNLKQIQYKLESFQSNIYTIQSSRDSYKQQLSKITSLCQELIKEKRKLVSSRNKLVNTLQEREKENENIQYLGNNISQRMAILQNQLKVFQEGARKHLVSVERHIKNQGLGVDQMKTGYGREVLRLKQLLVQKENIIQNLQREKYATQDNLEIVWKVATSDSIKMKNALKDSNIYEI